MLLLLLLLVFQLLQQRQILLCISPAWIDGQRLLVSLYCLVDIADSGQRIATVVPAIRPGGITEVFHGCFVVLTEIGGGTRPVTIFEQLRGLRIITGLQGALPLLVRRQPQVIPRLSLCLLWMTKK